MGGSSSKEVEDAVKAEEEAELKRQSERRQAEEKKRKDEAEKKANAEALKNKQEADREVEKERQKSLETSRKLVADYQMQVEVNEKRLEEMKKELKENVEKQKELIKKQGVDDVKEGMKQIQETKEKLVWEKTLIASEMNQLYEFKQENVKKEKEEEKKMRKEEEEKRKKHDLEVLELARKMNDVELEGQQKLTELAEEQAEFQKGMLEKKERLYSIQMSDAINLRQSQYIEQRHETFRRSCKSLIQTFSEFSRCFGSEEADLKGTRDDINQGIEILMAPELSLTLRTLRKLNAALQNFSVEGSSKPEEFESLRQVVIELVTDLETSITTIVSNIQSYQNHPPQEWIKKSEEPRAMSRTQSENEEFDVLTSGVKEKEPVDPVAVQKPNENASKLFNITELYTQTKDLIKQLSKEMLKFNVRACTAFDDQLAIQHTRVTERLRLGEASAAAAIEDAKKPIIQESNE